VKGFESAFAVLNGFAFASPVDRENALWLALWCQLAACGLGRPMRMPLVIIDGPALSGKNTLVQRCAELAGLTGRRRVEVFDASLTTLSDCAAKDRSLVVLDYCGANVGKAHQRNLSRFVTSDVWAVRKRKKTTHVRLECVTVLIGFGVKLGRELEARSIFIRLCPGPGAV